MFRRAVDLLSSLRLTVVCLAAALVLVFAGTLAQVDHGLYETQRRYFHSFVVWWSPEGVDAQLPMLPGGYTLAVVLLANLVAAHARRFSLRPGKLGILAIHLGLIVLLVGQLAAGALTEEGTMRIARGETAGFTEDLRSQELAIFDGATRLVGTPLEIVEGAHEIRFDELGVAVRVSAFWPHARLLTEPAEGALEMTTTRGAGAGGFFVLPLVEPPAEDERALPAAVLELTLPGGPAGSFVVSSLLRVPQTFELEGRTLEIALGPKRRHLPYSMTLVDLRHDLYTGTEIPRHFSSRVRIDNPERGEDREVVISMNRPLRYLGNTYYQYQMEADSGVTVLQVVRNPGWLAPYLSCGLVGLGLAVQFATGLYRAVRRSAE